MYNIFMFTIHFSLSISTNCVSYTIKTSNLTALEVLQMKLFYSSFHLLVWNADVNHTLRHTIIHGLSPSITWSVENFPLAHFFTRFFSLSANRCLVLFLEITFDWTATEKNRRAPKSTHSKAKGFRPLDEGVQRKKAFSEGLFNNLQVYWVSFTHWSAIHLGYLHGVDLTRRYIFI